MTSRRLLFLLLGLLTLLRLVYIGLVELSPDEMYYTMWSQHPDISYYSKGPGIAATIWLSTHLFGVTEHGVRFFSPLLALGTSLLAYFFARRLYDETVAVWMVLTLNVIPMFQVGALIMTIDPLMIFLWMAALYAFWIALEKGPGYNHWWALTGALIGLGFLCKWINAMEILSIVLFLAITRKHRKELGRRGFWVMIAVFVIFTIPPIVWNAQHDWITLHHLTARGGLNKAFHFNPKAFLTFLGGQLGVYSPLIYLGLLASLPWAWKRARNQFKPRFLLCFALPVLALYFFLAVKDPGEPNWTAPGILSLGFLAVAMWRDLAAEKRWARLYAVAGMAVGFGMAIFALDSDLVREAGLALPYELDPSARLRGWKTSAEAVETFRKKFEAESGKPVFLIGNKYQTAASLGFYLHEPRLEGPGHPPVYIPESQNMENEFSFWHRYDEFTELSDVARDYLKSNEASPEAREQLRQALSAAPTNPKDESTAAADARRRLVHALLTIAPQLPLDESFVEEQAVSLFAGRNALFITDEHERDPNASASGQDKGAPTSIKGGFERVEMVACIDIKRRDLPLRQLRIFACYNYHGRAL